MKGDKRTQIRKGVKGALRVGIDILPEYGKRSPEYRDHCPRETVRIEEPRSVQLDFLISRMSKTTLQHNSIK